MPGAQLKRRLACSEPDQTSAADEELTEAIREYQRTSGRLFPTWSEVLELVQRLGYQKRG